MFIAEQPGAVGWQDYGVLALQTLFVLAVLAAAAWAAVRFGRNRFVIRTKQLRMKVVERLAIEPKRSLYLVEIEGIRLVIGSSERGINIVQSLGAADGADESEKQES